MRRRSSWVTETLGCFVIIILQLENMNQVIDGTHDNYIVYDCLLRSWVVTYKRTKLRRTVTPHLRHAEQQC